MSAPKCHLPCSPIIRLEEAGTSLVAAFKDYLNICHNLGADLLLQGTKVEDIATGIDSTLETVYTVMRSHHLDETRSILIRTRNALTSPFFRFPEEAMSEIFENAVFNPRYSETSTPLPLSQHVRVIYHRLYDLFGVCSTWRDTIMARQALWSVIPMVDGFPAIGRDLFWRVIERAGGSKRYLAVAFERPTFDAMELKLSRVLIDYGPRLSSINIAVDEHSIVQDIINMLLERGAPNSLSQLFIQLKNKEAQAFTIPPLHSGCIVAHSSQENSFARLISGLKAFRISGITLHWGTLAFSARLVELQIGHMVLGYDSMLAPFMQALSSASELRDLKLIDVKTYRLQVAASDTDTPLPLSFSKLQSLHLEDLCLNTLKALFLMINLGPHHLTLYLTESSVHHRLRVNHGDGSFLSRVHITELYTVLRHNPIRTLMISGSQDSDTLWLTGSAFRGLLEAMPILKMLKMDFWHFDKAVWTDLNRRNYPRLPALEKLYMTSTIIHSTKGFWGTIASHPLQQVVLGGTIGNNIDGARSREPIQEGSSIVQWLQAHVPEFYLVDDAYRSAEFYLAEWQLW